jgi:hypothetical protein
MHPAQGAKVGKVVIVASANVVTLFGRAEAALTILLPSALVIVALEDCRSTL